MTPFFSRKGVRELYLKINEANRGNGRRLKSGELLLGPPRTVSGGEYNTSVLTWADPSLSYAGGVFFRYNRVDITRAFEQMWGKESELVLDIAGYTKVSQLLKAIERRYSLELDPEDIIDVDLDQSAAYFVAELKTSALSYIYKGSIALHLFNSNISKTRKTSSGQLRRTNNGIRLVNQEE